MPAYLIRAYLEGSDDLGLDVIARDLEECLLYVRSALSTGQTLLHICEQDRAIRDGRRAAGLRPDVPIVGEPGWRHV
jgi:hypothetical protein